MPDSFQNPSSKRPERIISHALVELRKFQWLPFKVYSAVLLDLSQQGCKVELTSEHVIKEGEIFWLSIPLSPLGLRYAGNFKSKIQVRWFDQRRFRIGGVFVDMEPAQAALLVQVLDHIRERWGI